MVLLGLPLPKSMNKTCAHTGQGSDDKIDRRMLCLREPQNGMGFPVNVDDQMSNVKRIPQDVALVCIGGVDSRAIRLRAA